MFYIRSKVFVSDSVVGHNIALYVGPS